MKRESTSSVTPVHRPKGVSSVKKLPVNWWAALMGRPCSRSPNATPASSGISALPIVSAQRQAERQRGSSNLRWYSKATPRTISASSSTTRAR